jgi:hypothetical protein
MEKEMEKKYVVIKDFGLFEYIVAHHKNYRWKEYWPTCAEFQEDMKKWGFKCNFHAKDIIFNGGLFSDNFYTHAVKFGFIQEVKEEVFYKKGDHFTKDGHEFMLYSGQREVWVDLVDINTGNKPMEICLYCSNPDKIPALEFHNWAGKDMVKKEA